MKDENTKSQSLSYSQNLETIQDIQPTGVEQSGPEKTAPTKHYMFSWKILAID